MKKLLSVCLCMALAVGTVSSVPAVTANAEETEGVLYEPVAADTLDMPALSGEDKTEYTYEDSGNKYKYVILDDGTVKIKNLISHDSENLYIPAVINGRKVTVIGSGAFRWVEKTKKLVIPEGVKEIEAFAFDNSDIGEIVMPDSVEEIGQCAFYKLANTFKGDLVLPISLKKLGYAAFAGCTGITGVEMPASLKIINDSAFAECTGLTGITLPDDLEEFGVRVFEDCESLAEINTNPNSKNFSSFDGVLYSKDRKKVLAFPMAKTGHFVMPDTVEVVGEHAFKNAKITSIQFSKKLRYLANFAFAGCKDLQGKLVLPDSLGVVEANSFSGCSGVTELYLGEKTDCDYRQFTCSFKNLQNIYVSEKHPSYVSENGVLFSKDKTVLYAYPGARTGHYTIPDGVTAIGKNAFDGSVIQSITFPQGLEIIEDRSFQWCENLCYVDGSFESLKEINLCAFQSCKSLRYFPIPESLEYLGEGAFWGCSSMESVYIESEKLGEIRENTFLQCTGLVDVKFPYRLKSIDDSAFEECPNLFFHCYVNSAAQIYAENHGIRYELTPTGLLYGDINYDSRITTSDALITLRIAVGAIREEEYSNIAADVNYDGKITEIDIKYMKLAGDINGDGKITASDSLSILRYAVGADLSSNVGIPVDL